MKLPSLILLFVFVVLSASPCLADGVAGAAASAASGAAAGAAGAASSGVNWDNVVDMGKTQRAMKMRELEDLIDFGGSQNQCKGSTCISRSGGKPSEKFAKTASGALGRNVFKYGKFLNAAGKLSGWGSLAYAAIQLAQMYKDKQLQNEPALQGPLNEALGRDPGTLGPGSATDTPCGYRRIVQQISSVEYCLSGSDMQPSCSGDTLKTFEEVPDLYNSCRGSRRVIQRQWRTEPAQRPEEPGTDPGTDPGTNPGTEPGNNPKTLTDKQLQDFVDRLDELLKENDQLAQDIADALDNIIAKNPQQYLDWAPFSPQEFEDGMLQGKLEDAIQQRESATDPATQKQLDDLIGRLSDRANRNELERQKREQGQEQGQEDQKPKEDEPKEEFKPPEVSETELKAIDFQPIVDLKDKMMTKFPFNLLTAFGSAIDILKAEPKAPSFEINLGFDKPIIVDFSALDSFASFIRAVMSFLIFGACGWGCFRMWSRF